MLTLLGAVCLVDPFEADLDAPATGTGEHPMRAVLTPCPGWTEMGSGVQVLGRVSPGDAAGRTVTLSQGT